MYINSSYLKLKGNIKLNFIIFNIMRFFEQIFCSSVTHFSYFLAVKEIKESFIHLLRGLLVVDPRQRWSPVFALTHPFLKGGFESLENFSKSFSECDRSPRILEISSPGSLFFKKKRFEAEPFRSFTFPDNFAVDENGEIDVKRSYVSLKEIIETKIAKVITGKDVTLEKVKEKLSKDDADIEHEKQKQKRKNEKRKSMRSTLNASSVYFLLASNLCLFLRNSSTSFRPFHLP